MVLKLRLWCIVSVPGSEYWTSEHTLKLIANEGYFDNEELAGSSNGIMCSGKVLHNLSLCLESPLCSPVHAY